MQTKIKKEGGEFVELDAFLPSPSSPLSLPLLRLLRADYVFSLLFHFYRAATLSSTLITSLPSSSVLQSTYLLPPQSILTTLKGQSFPPSQHLPKGMHTLLIDTSTLDVEVFRSVARQMGEQTNGGTGMVDAPFLGGESVRLRLFLRSLVESVGDQHVPDHTDLPRLLSHPLRSQASVKPKQVDFSSSLEERNPPSKQLSLFSTSWGTESPIAELREQV